MVIRLIDILEHESSGTPPPDVDPPYLLNQSPAPDEFSVARGRVIAFRVTDLLNQVDGSTLVVSINLGSGWETAYSSNLGGFQAGFITGSTITPVGNGFDLSIHHSTPMDDYGLVEVRVECADTSALANALDVTYSFRAADESPPLLEGLSPGNEELDVPEASTVHLSVNDTGSGVDLATLTIDIQQGIFGAYEPAVIAGVIVAPWDGVGSGITPNTSGGYDVSLSHTSGSLILDDAVYVRVAASDLEGNELSGAYVFSTFFTLKHLVEFLDIGRDGGGPVTITVTGMPAGTYGVYAGMLSSTEDPEAYCGRPGSGHPNWIEFGDIGGGKVQATNVYLPPMPVGDNSPTFSPIAGGPIIYGSASIHVHPPTYRSRVLMLRRILPPWYQTGPRFAEQERPE